MGTLIIQLAYGGLVAGLKAGYVSNTWPLMFGRVVPSGLLSTYEPWWRNLYEPLGSHWIHRWFAFVVAAIVLAVLIRIRRDGTRGNAEIAINWLTGAVIAQIGLGVLVVLLGVPKWFALAHQGLGVVMFGLVLVIAHQAHTEREPAPAGSRY